MPKKHTPNNKSSPRPLDVTWRVLRSALDRLEFAYHTHLCRKVWQRCLKAWSTQTPITLKLRRRRGRTTTVVLTAEAGKSDREPDRIIFTDPGTNLKIHVRRPYATDAGSAPAPYRCVRVTIHGSWFSQRRTGMTLVEQVRTAIEERFFKDRGATPQARRKALAPVTRPCRFDVAHDIEVGGADADTWIEQDLYAGGNRDRALRPWPAWSHREGGTPGTPKHGRSVVLVATHFRRTTYEKDKQMRHKKPAAWPGFQRVLRKCGWSGHDRLLRDECSFGAEWFRSQTFTLDGRTIRGRDASVDDLLTLLPTIMVELWRRTPHRAPHPTRRRDRWPLSAFWMAVKPDPALLARGRKGATSVGTMQTERQAAACETRWARGVAEVLRLAEVGGTDGASLTVKAVLKRLGRDARRRRAQPEFTAVRRRWRAEAGRSEKVNRPVRSGQRAPRQRGDDR
ncbi:MAG: hypothetical protein U0324_27250 [Polyangiales bacterium]